MEDLKKSDVANSHAAEAPRGSDPRPPTPYPLHPTPHTLHPATYTLHSTPYTLHPTPYTLHLTPYTLQPTAYSLQPTPYSPHPTPLALGILLADLEKSDVANSHAAETPRGSNPREPCPDHQHPPAQFSI